VCAGPGHERAARAQRAELIADAAAGLEGEPGFVDLAQDAVHRIFERARDGAVDGAGGRLVRLRAGIGNDAAGGNGATAQRPGEARSPVPALVLGEFGIGQGVRHAQVSGVDIRVQRLALLGLEPVLLVPDVQRGRLQRYFAGGQLRGNHVRLHRAHSRQAPSRGHRVCPLANPTPWGTQDRRRNI